MNLPLTIKNRKYLKRYKEILQILTKNGFGFIADIVARGGYVPFYTLRVHNYVPIGERIRKTLEELGPTFIKMGQLLSTRADLIPQDILEELSKLQDDVIPDDFETIKSIIENELNGTIPELFMNFNTVPIASASIGQVYRAKTVNGEDVVVKVQRPNVEYKINADIIILKGIARILNERIIESPVDFIEIINELSNSLLNELNYTLEGNNADRFRENFANEDYIYIPKVYWKYTTKKVLTMEYINGTSIKNRDILISKGFDLKEIARKGAWSILLQIYEFGFFHGDPHPGNILVKDDGKISYIDFGIVGYLDRSNREMLIELFKAFADNDAEEVVNILADLGAIRDNTNIRNLKSDMRIVINYFYNTPLKNINMNDTMRRIMSVVYKYKLMLPSEFILLLKSLATIEGVGNDLDPDFSISNVAKDFIRQVYIRNFSLSKIIKENSKDLHKTIIELRKLPNKIQSIMTKVIKDDVKIKINIDETENMKHDLNIMINKIIISIIASALIVGSSLVLTFDNGYKIFGYNAVGLFGFIISFILCLWVFYRIFIFEKRKK